MFAFKANVNIELACRLVIVHMFVAALLKMQHNLWLHVIKEF